MMLITRAKTISLTSLLSVILALLLLSGCSMFQGSEDETAHEPSPENAPYYPSWVNDIQIPGELKEIRDNSLYINTASFVGGIKTFSGRVEINSLSDFFISTMQKNGWKKVGDIQYRNVLLAFTKPNKTCMISIFEGSIGMKAKVYIYVTEDTEGASMREESFR